MVRNRVAIWVIESGRKRFAGFYKALSRKDLRRGGGRGFDASAYAKTLYGKQNLFKFPY